MKSEVLDRKRRNLNRLTSVGVTTALSSIYWIQPVVNSITLPVHAQFGSNVCCLFSELGSISCIGGMKTLNGNFDNFGPSFVVTAVKSSVASQSIEIKLDSVNVNLPIWLPTSGTLNIEIKEEGLSCESNLNFSVGTLTVYTNDEITQEFSFNIPEGFNVG